MIAEPRTKAYDTGYSYYDAGGKDKADNPFREGSTAYKDWINGYNTAKGDEYAHYNEGFTDNCGH